MNNLAVRDLKQYLNSRSKDQLIGEVVDLFSKVDLVKDYYQSKLGSGDNEEVSKKYKSVIRNEFFPPRGFGRGRLSVAKKAVSDLQESVRFKTRHSGYYALLCGNGR